MMDWKICPAWPAYEISSHGDVRRIEPALSGFVGLRKPYIAANGRYMIVMRKEGESRACHISRLVLEAFVGPAPSLTHQCAHNDGNALNNHVGNLRWATPSENQMDRVLHGTSNRGERFARARLTEDAVRVIKQKLQRGVHPRALAGQFKVAETTIKSIKQGKSWAWLPAIPQDGPSLEGK